jgi:heat shock factor-binding protein 1
MNSVRFDLLSESHAPTNIVPQTTTDTSASAELSAVVDELLNSLSNKFAGVSSEIFAKSKHWIEAGTMVEVDANIYTTVDEMSRRLDNLEATLQSSSEGRDGKSSLVKQ